MRLATFNIKHGEISGLGAIAEALRAVDADVVGLQEVDRGVRRSGGGDQARLLGEQLGMAWAFGRAMDLEGGAYGCALLVKPALTSGSKIARPLPAESLALPGGGAPGEEPRVLLWARVGALRIFVSHLDLPAATRVAQAEAIAAAMGEARLCILLCDGNESVQGPAVARLLSLPLRDSWTEAGAPERPTAPLDRPQERIDHVLLGAGAGPARAARAIDTAASDHPLVVVDL